MVKNTSFVDKPWNTAIKFSENPAVINESVTITCSSDALPKPNYTIYRNDIEVASSMTYTIIRVNRTHGGTYKCIANNSLGKDSASDFLAVNGKIVC